jgi:putative transposase
MNRKKLTYTKAEDGLNASCSPRRLRNAGASMSAPLESNQVWSLNLLSEPLTDRCRICILAVSDDFTHECLFLTADTSFSDARAIRDLDILVELRGHPAVIAGNARELTSTEILEWARKANTTQLQIGHAGLDENTSTKPLKQTLRKELLNKTPFPSLDYAREAPAVWKTTTTPKRTAISINLPTPILRRQLVKRNTRPLRYSLG